MNKSKILNVILIITCIEILILIICPIYILNTNDDMELGALVIGGIFAAIIISYLIYLIALVRFLKSKPFDPKTGMWVFLNVLPLTIYFLLYFVS